MKVIKRFTINLFYVLLAFICFFLGFWAGVVVNSPAEAAVIENSPSFDDNSYAGANVTTLSPVIVKQLTWSGGGQPWSTLALATSSGTCTDTSDEIARFWCFSSVSWMINESIVAYDLSSIPAGSQIKNVRLITRNHATIEGGSPASWTGSYLTWYKTLNPDNHTITTADWDLARLQGAVPAFQYKSISSLPSVDGTLSYYDLYAGYISQFLSWKNSANRIFFTFNFQRSMLNAQPDVYNGGHTIQSWGVGSAPTLEITFTPTAPARIVYVGTNAAVNTLTTGTEVSHNITWGSPRCAYNDDQFISGVQGAVYFIVNGDSGANVTLKCIGSDGTLLAAQIDSVRVDGIYNWSFSIPSNYSGWIRAYEQNSGLYSTWGYVDKSPSPTMLNLTTYARYTSFPQYDYPFGDFSVWKDGMMFDYWASNIDSSELAAYNLSLWSSGNSTNGVLFDNTLAWMADNYYSINYTLNRYLAANRFAIFSPQIVSSGYNTGDGLVFNLNKEYDLSTSGFIVPVLRDNILNQVIASCHTAYYYLQSYDKDGVSISVDAFNQANGIIAVYINVGKYSMIPDRLSNLTVQLIDDNGYVYGTAYGSIIAGQNVAGLQSPDTGGSYQVRCTFYNNDISPYYSLILDTPIAITGGITPTSTPPGGTVPGPVVGGPGDWTKWIGSLIKKVGLDNEAGHWLIIFILCAVWVVFLHKNGLALTIMICLTVGAGLIMQWLNPWFYILLALGAAVFIFGMFKRKTNSTGEA